jgi:HEAT repeat protein
MVINGGTRQLSFIMPGRRFLIALVFFCSFVGAHPAQEAHFLGKPPLYWLEQLNDRRPGARRAAAFALGKLGAGAYSPQTIRLLAEHAGNQEEDAAVRAAAAQALGELALILRKYTQSKDAWHDCSGTLLQALSTDKDPRVRRAAAYAIGGFGKVASQSRGPVRTALKDESPGVRQNAAWALGQLGGEQAVESLQSLGETLQDKDPLVRRDAAAAIGSVGRLRDAKGQPLVNPALPVLMEMFKAEKDVTIRKTALDALVNAVGPQDRAVAADLRNLLKDTDSEIVRGAALALGNMGGSEADAAVPVLRQELKSPDTLARIQASAALANIGKGAAQAVPDLVQALEDKEAGVRRSAALALSRIGKDAAAAVPALARHLRPEELNVEVRKFAAEALAQQQGDDLVPAVPELLAAIRNDKAAAVRQRSIWALFGVRDLEALGIVQPLTEVLQETGDDMVLVRYDAARCLGYRLRDKAPDKAVEVLLEMLKDKRLRVYEGSGADVTGSSVEGAKGGATVEMTLGSDARFLAIEALIAIGRPKASRPEVIEALEEAAKSEFSETRDEAKKALKALRGQRRN